MANDLIYDLELRLDKAEKQLNSLNKSAKKKAKKTGKTAGQNFGNAMAKAIGAIIAKISFTSIINQSNNAINAFDRITKSNIALERAVDATNRSLEEMGKSLDIREVNQAIDTLFEKFEGTVTQPALQTAFADLFRGGINNIDEASKLLEGFIDISSTGKSEFISLDSAVRQLAEQFRSERAALGETAGLTDEYISDILPRGLKALQEEGKLRGKKVDDLTKEERALAKVAGLQENFNLTQGNFQQQLESRALEQDKYNAKLLEMQEAFGKALKPIQILVFEALTPFLEKLTQFIQENPQIVAGLTIVAGVFTAVAGAVLGVMSAIGFLSPVIATATKLFGIGAVTGTAGAGATGGGVGLAGAVAGLAGPIGWVVLGIGAVIAVMVSLYKNVDVFRNRVNSSFEFVKNSVTGLKDNFALNVGKIIGFFITLPVKLPFWIGKALVEVGKKIANFDWSGTWDGLLDSAKDIGEKIKNYFTSGEFTNSIKSGVKGVLSGAVQGTPLEGRLGFATGGKVFGAGTGISDSVKAMLSKGEFVVNAKSTSMFEPLLRAINNMGNTTNNSSTTNNYGVNFSSGFSNPNFLLT